VRIQIQYFAQLRGLGGPASIEVTERTTVDGLLSQLFLEIPGLKAWDRHLLVAAGTEWVQRQYALKPGDEISLMPPVQGG
jgi:molybdopterin converting factor small subunit